MKCEHTFGGNVARGIGKGIGFGIGVGTLLVVVAVITDLMVPDNNGNAIAGNGGGNGANGGGNAGASFARRGPTPQELFRSGAAGR